MSIIKTCLICQKIFTSPTNAGVCCSKPCGYKYRDRFNGTEEERFWSKVDKSAGLDACWLWQGSFGHSGYGLFKVRGKMARAHRKAYELTYGEIPEAMMILHSCPDNKDEPSCVNPTHLRPGTHQENMMDRNSRGRQVHGESHASAKLTVDQVKEIRSLHASGSSIKGLSKRFGIARPGIKKLVDRKTWASIA